MCPACITTVALIVAGATTPGGLTAVVVKKRRRKNGAKNIDPTSQTKGRSKMDTNCAIAFVPCADTPMTSKQRSNPKETDNETR
jgi:hypothetical protein